MHFTTSNRDMTYNISMLLPPTQLYDSEPSTNNYSRADLSKYFSSSHTIENPNHNFKVPPLKLGDLSDLKYDPNSKTVTGHPGLKEYLRLKSKEAPSYIFDAHNFAFFAWVEALHEGRIIPGATLLHFDDHADAQVARIPIYNLTNLQNAAGYSENLFINEFIEPAIKTGLINKVEWISPSFANDRDRMSYAPDDSTLSIHQTGITGPLIQQIMLSRIDPNSLIVDIDLDYFTAETWKKDANLWGFRDTQERYQNTINTMRTLISMAGVTTIATSPSHFLDQHQAIRIACELLQ